ncbi:MAG: response regulator, partial [Chitinophagales bacterium]
MTISTHKFNVLVVEDNEGDFILIEDFLKEKMNNPFVQQAKSFAGATGVLDKNKQFDVILLDLSLPDISGEELVKKISKLAEQIPIIVLTGYAQKNFGVKTLSLGVSDYLLKDEFTPTELYKSIIYSIERKRINSKLKESEQKYRHIFHSSPLPMWVYEIDTLRFLDVNNAAVRHYGYS